MARTADGAWSVTGAAELARRGLSLRGLVYVARRRCHGDTTCHRPVQRCVDHELGPVRHRRSEAPRPAPAGWAELGCRPRRHPVDSAIYELHVRDFSIDRCVGAGPAHRGRYLAFTGRDSNGMRHLAELADAGLNTVHLLPTFDFSSVDDRAERQLAARPATSPN